MDLRWRKAKWISDQLTGSDAVLEDAYDVLLGNITEPQDFVDEVMTLSTDFDLLQSRGRYQRSVIGE